MIHMRDLVHGPCGRGEGCRAGTTDTQQHHSILANIQPKLSTGNFFDVPLLTEAVVDLCTGHEFGR